MAFGVARLLQHLDNFMCPQFVLQRLRQCRRLAGLADLLVDILKFQSLLEVLEPAVQLRLTLLPDPRQFEFCFLVSHVFSSIVNY